MRYKELFTFHFPLFNSARGYIALASILVIAAVVLTIGISVSLLSISEIQTSLAEKKKEETLDFVEACVEEALLRLNKDDDIPTPTISLPEGTCSVSIESHVGDDWTFTVSGQIDNYRKTIRVIASRESKVDVISWQEIE